MCIKCVLNLHWMLRELLTFCIQSQWLWRHHTKRHERSPAVQTEIFQQLLRESPDFIYCVILYWSDDNCNVFYSRGEILVRDSNRSDWIYIVKSVSTQTQSNQWAQHNQLQISNTTTDMALCIAIHNWFISWFKSLNRPTSIILYAKHGIIPLSLQKLDLYW